MNSPLSHQSMAGNEFRRWMPALLSIGLAADAYAIWHLTIPAMIYMVASCLVVAWVYGQWLQQKTRQLLTKFNRQLSESTPDGPAASARMPDASPQPRHLEAAFQHALQQARLQTDFACAEMDAEYQQLRQEMAQRSQTLEYLTRFQRLLSSCFSELTLTPVQEIDKALVQTMSQIGTFMHVERVSLFQFDDQHNTVRYTHEWVADGHPSSIQDLEVMNPDSFPWWFRTIRQGMMIIENVNDLPAEASIEKTVLQAHGIKSLVALPLFHNEGLIGYITYDALSNYRDWQEEELTLLNLANTLFVGSIVNVRRYRDLQQAQERLEQTNRSLEALSRTDALTGLANRRYFDEIRAIEFRRALRSGQPFSLILCDLDHFKRYNDTLGHVAGDEAIRQFAHCMQRVFTRSGDLSARVGGEEFAVLLPNTAQAQAVNLAEQLKNRLWQLQLTHPSSPTADRLTTSIGVVTLHPDMHANIDALYSSADRALYEAKALGRNRVVSGSS